MANENGARHVSLEPKARDTGGKPVATPRSASLPVTGSFSQSSDRGFCCARVIVGRVLGKAGVIREGVEAASRGDDLASIEHAVQRLADVLVLLLLAEKFFYCFGVHG